MATRLRQSARVASQLRNSILPLEHSSSILRYDLDSSLDVRSNSHVFYPRHLSNKPEQPVYSGPSAASPSRITLRTIRQKYAKGIPITMMTAYDYPSAVHVDTAGIDMLLVGDSSAMVVHGHDTTLPITLDEMLSHCKAVCRGSQRSFIVGDLPFGSFEQGPAQAVASSVRMLKEGGVDAVKIEGGFPARAATVSAIVQSGIAVVGHVGLTPQSISTLGGFRPAGQTATEALRIMKEAAALEAAGCFCIVLECVPDIVARAVTRELNVPTIGIGSGSGCSGQVLVYHDMLGLMQHPHHAKVTPKFCKRYASIGDMIQKALGEYVSDVESRAFPSEQYSPYKMAEGEEVPLGRALERHGFSAAAEGMPGTRAAAAEFDHDE